MPRLLNILVRFLSGLDFLLVGFVYMLIHLRASPPPDTIIVSGPGRLFFMGFLLIGGALVTLYDEDMYYVSKRLSLSGIVVTLGGLFRAVEEVIDKAYHDLLYRTAVPPFYIPLNMFETGVENAVSRIGSILIILSMMMVVPIIAYDEFRKSQESSLIASNLSIPSLVLLSGFVIGHEGFLIHRSVLVITLLKLFVLLPAFSLLLIDVYLALRTIPKNLR